jgi:peptidoglycan/LPS O-acetylase OafA/YrhL
VEEHGWGAMTNSHTATVQFNQRGACRIDEGRPRHHHLDALRGLAILGVFAVHAGQLAELSGYAAQLTSFGARGVQLFYIVSAFTLLTVSAHSRGISRFFLRRFFRIAPAFYIAMAASLLFYGLAPRYFAPDGIGTRHIILTALFLHGWLPDTITSVVPGGWSIACEMMFYLAFPLLAKSITDFRRAIGAFFLACIVAIFTLHGLPKILPPPTYLANNFAYLFFTAQAPAFMAGFIVFYLPRLNKFYAISTCLSALIMLITMAAVGGRAAHYILTLIPFSLLIWGMSNTRLVILDNIFIRFLGLLSYSIYLFHFIIIDLISRKLGNSAELIFGGGFLACIIISFLAYRIIERPGILLGERVADRFLGKPNKFL